MISDTEQKTTGAKAAKLIDSPVGRLYIAAQETGLTDLLFVTELTPDPTATAAADEATRILEETERQLQPNAILLRLPRTDRVLQMLYRGQLQS